MRPSAFTNRPAYESKFLPNNYNLNQLRVSGWYAPLGTLQNAPENFTLYDLFVIAPNPDIYATQMAFGISYRMVEVSSTEGDVDIVQNEIVQDKNGNIVYTHRRAGVDEDDDGTPDYDDMIMTVGADSYNVLRIVTDDSLPLDVTISENLGKETPLSDLKKYINKKVADISKDEIVHSNGDSSLSNIGEIGKMVFTDDNGNVYSLDDMSTSNTTADVSIKDDVITAKIHKNNDQIENNDFGDEIVVNANDFSSDDSSENDESKELLDKLDDNYNTIYLNKDKTTNYLTTLGEAENKKFEETENDDRLVVRPKAIVEDEAELVILNRSAVYVRSYVNGSWTSWVILGQSTSSAPSSTSTSTDDDEGEVTTSVNFEKIYSYIDTKLSFDLLFLAEHITLLHMMKIVMYLKHQHQVLNMNVLQIFLMKVILRNFISLNLKIVFIVMMMKQVNSSAADVTGKQLLKLLVMILILKQAMMTMMDLSLLAARIKVIM